LITRFPHTTPLANALPARRLARCFAHIFARAASFGA
jgi:hypothetical protein